MYNIKKQILLLLVMFLTALCIQTNAQTTQKTLFGKLDQVNKFHTIDDLEDSSKGELVKLYLERNKELTTVMPFIALTTKPDQKLQDIGIRNDAANNKLLAKYKTNEKKLLDANSKIITEFISYADSENLIWSILYMEDIIKKLRLGFKGNF